MLHLNLYLKNYWEAQVDEFKFVKYEDHFTDEEPCNIYLIGIRPRVIIDPTYLEVGKKSVELKFRIQDQFEFQDIKAKLPLEREIVGKIELETDKPYSRFNLKDEKGYFFDKQLYAKKDSIVGKALYALRKAEYDSKSLNHNFNDLELLYIF